MISKNKDTDRKPLKESLRNNWLPIYISGNSQTIFYLWSY